MSERTFDLTVPVTRPLRVLWRTLGVIQVVSGLLHLSRGDHLLGGLSVVVGVLLVMPVRFFLRPLKRYIILLGDEHIQIKRGLFKNRTILWSSISEVRVALMSVEFHVTGATAERINFGEMGYRENQTVKPEVLSAVRSFVEAKGINVTDN